MRFLRTASLVALLALTAPVSANKSVPADPAYGQKMQGRLDAIMARYKAGDMKGALALSDSLLGEFPTPSVQRGTVQNLRMQLLIEMKRDAEL